VTTGVSAGKQTKTLEQPTNPHLQLRNFKIISSVTISKTTELGLASRLSAPSEIRIIYVMITKKKYNARGDGK